MQKEPTTIDYAFMTIVSGLSVLLIILVLGSVVWVIDYLENMYDDSHEKTLVETIDGYINKEDNLDETSGEGLDEM